MVDHFIRSTYSIYAQATAPGRAAISVLRLSGPHVRDALRQLSVDLPPARVASLRTLRDGTGSALDRALVIWMPGPRSFTGEDVAELHLHGGLAVRTGVLRALGESGLRPAEAGEFTRRAFSAGRMDLSEVEGLADLIDAETESQRHQALRQLDGALSRQAAAWRARLVEACSLLEAGLDFSDEEDVGAGISDRALSAAADVAGEVRAELAVARRGERIRDGVTVVIAGPPYAGKSTRLNALAARDVAIVSPVPGTTRDAIEVRCDLGGMAVTFVDTAGLRDTADVIEMEGISRTRRRAAEAELVLWLDPLDAPADPPAALARDLLVVKTKLDLVPPPRADGLAVSAERGDGLDHLGAAVRRHIDAAMAGQGDALITRERHRLAFLDLAESLERAPAAHAAGHDELAAEDLRLGLRALGRITGEVDVEEILDGVFGQFCIGK